MEQSHYELAVASLPYCKKLDPDFICVVISIWNHRTRVFRFYRTDSKFIYLHTIFAHSKACTTAYKWANADYDESFEEYSFKLDLESFRPFYPLTKITVSHTLFCHEWLPHIKYFNLLIDHTNSSSCLSEHCHLTTCPICHKQIDLEILPNVNRKTLKLWDIWKAQIIESYIQWIFEELLEAIFYICCT